MKRKLTHLLLVVIAGVATCLGLGAMYNNVGEGSEISTERQRIAAQDREFQEFNARLRRGVRIETNAEFLARHAEKMAEDIKHEEDLKNEADRLANAMETYAREHDHTSERLIRVLDLHGLAQWLVGSAEQRKDRWLPLGRSKAPALLASIARYEVSWQWKNPPRGAIGEGCSFQISPTAAHLTGTNIETVIRSRDACFEAAVTILHICSDKCGETPFERVLNCYATGGTCEGVPEVVGPRMQTARWLLERANNPT